jgi:DNA (cytosine-5)-methyltransferase 1
VLDGVFMSRHSRNSTRRPALVSLFTGAGGLDIGLEHAGFGTVAAVDSDPDCAKTLRLNKGRRLECITPLSDAVVLDSPIEKIEPEHLRPEDAPDDWVPDLLAGGPPCQPFSSAGNMLALDDPRGRLFEHFVRIAEGLKPRLILFENVRGLVTAVGPSGEPGEALALVKKAFESIGYSSRFALLNAADYGAPQRRVRLFMLATSCTVLPSFPAPTHAESPEPLFGTLPWRTLGAFLEEGAIASEDEIERPSATLAPLLETLAPGSGLKSPGARETTRPGGHWGYKQGTFVADPNRPARTVTASATQDWIRDPQGRLRRLTWRECAALQGFPAEWEFAGNKASRFRQIGNAVPAVFGKVLGEALLTALASPVDGKVESAPLPDACVSAIDYTKREHRRNGASRRAVRSASLNENDAHALSQLKGLGSVEGSPAKRRPPPTLDW